MQGPGAQEDECRHHGRHSTHQFVWGRQQHPAGARADRASDQRRAVAPSPGRHAASQGLLKKGRDHRMADAARLAEAAECEKKALDCLKTSMLKLKFNPDFDGAAAALERAAVCYRNASKPQEAARVLQQAAVHYNSCNNRFHAAKARESAAVLLRDSGDYSAAYPLFEGAIDGYAECGSLDTAAMTVEKAAKVIAEKEPLKAIKLYEKGLSLVQQTDRSKMAGQFLSAITKLSLRAENYDRALSSIRDEIDIFLEVGETPRVGQLAIGLVLVRLAQEDSVAALQEYGRCIQKCPPFEFTDDAQCCQNLIASYESGDDEAFQNVLKSGSLRSMDNDYLRLQRKLKTPALEGNGEGGSSTADNQDDDDLR